MNWFVLAVVVLELGAGVQYGIQRQWLLSLVWTGYGVASVGLFLIGERTP